MPPLCAEKRITHIRYLEKRVFTNIQHTIFCLKSKSRGKEKERGKTGTKEKGQKEEKEKIKSKRKRYKKKLEI